MNRLTNNRAQGLVEYIILITLMGIALIATIRVLQSRTDAKFKNAAQEIRGL